MKRVPFFVFCLFYFTLSAFAQTDDVQKAINKDVWKPFMISYAAFDTDAFMAVHTEDVIRINRDGKNIRIGEEYRKGQAQGNERNKKVGAQRSIEFSFLERFAREDIAFESGYYKVKSKRPEQEERTFYGHFHVVLKKVDGVWKLWMDSDTSHDGTLGEEDFKKGEIFKP